MPRHEPAKKDVASCEKPRGAASERRSGDVRMGKPGAGNTASSREGSQPRELKHLSTWRKRNQTRDSPSSGERTGNSPNPRRVTGVHRCAAGVVSLAWAGCTTGRVVKKLACSGTSLGRTTAGGESPVHETRRPTWGRHLSTVGHVKSCRNPGGPSSKAKHVAATDSAEVP